MKDTIDVNTVSKIFTSIIIFVSIIIAIISFNSLEINNKEKEKEHALEVINKALVQCYALEGNYPANIIELKDYGVKFNNDKYIYHYEPFGNHVPSVMIVDAN